MGLEQIVADGQLLVASLIALAAGLVSFLSPCVLPLIPGYLAYVSGIADGGASTSTSASVRAGAAGGTDPVVASGAAAGDSTSAATNAAVNSAATATDAATATTDSAATQAAATQAAYLAATKHRERRERRRMVLGSLLFVAGFTLVFLLINILAGSLGTWLWQWQDLILRVMGVVVILMGVVFMGAFSAMQRTSRLKLKPKVGLAGAPVLGIVFAIGWAPCMGPTLGVVLALAMQSGSTGRASILALAYCLGLGLPFVLAAFGFGWMTQTMTFFKRHIRAVNLIGGGLLILIGLMMVTGLWSRMMFSLQAVMGNFATIL